MSSTNRGASRNANDYYATPIRDIMTFLDEFVLAEPGIFNQHDLRILDPSAGGDYISPMRYPEALSLVGVPKENILTMDIREDSPARFTMDYLEAAPFSRSPDMIITNPPFALALPFIEKALGEVISGGFVIALLRLNFFGSQSQYPFWKENLPKYCFVHHKRISFTSDGKTDNIEYMHAVWEKDLKVNFTKLKVI